ncbi:sperm flagellar protein 2-like [Nylanderia fulva]|uniref:sperm flagellar protein 2-like n=1 Tax=Nylanderia fulva TaxID=613905 RepID=UPI0010FBA34A|nr:sperm flagellar protein 2-like [Nylanderia fulva]
MLISHRSQLSSRNVSITSQTFLGARFAISGPEKYRNFTKLVKFLMADTLKAWLHTRLGVIVDLTPEMFGRYSRDGTLLAQILHSYDIISSSQLSTIMRTQDPALSRVNLKILRIWLKLINVTLSDECIDEISKGKGAAALQLYYKVHLSLEGKDRLHFIALQKERKYMPSRFDISKVSEDPPSYQPPEHPLSQPLIESADTILWHRSKFWMITQSCRRERQRFEALMKYPVVESVEDIVPEELPDEKEIASKTLDEFARKHPPQKTKKYHVVECCPRKKLLAMPSIEDPVAAARYIDLLKKRSEKAAKSHASKLKIQTTMMTEAWEQLLRKQDRSFDEALGRRVLDQSRYEKQMMRKLCEVRDLRNRIVENRRIVDMMLLTARENELRMKEDRHREALKEEIKDVEMEERRMCELRWKIREEKMHRIKEKHRGICLKIIEDLTDIAIKIADYRQANNNHIPYSIWSEWKTSFLRNQPIFKLVDQLDNFEEIEDVEEIKNNEETRNNKGIIKNKNYHNLDSPWDQFVSKAEEKDEEVVKLGRIVLGYIVHRLLEILYPYPSETANCPVPRVKVAAIILGIINPTLHEQLRELLKKNGIYLLRMEDAINHCLERYKREMADVKYIDLNIVSATTRDIKKLETKMDILQDRHLRKTEKTTRIATSQQNAAEEKQTQTPRQIPYDDMDPILSDTAYIVTRRNRDLIEEWRYAVLFEIDRINQRLNVLNAAARFDMIFLLDTMKETFHSVYHHIIERYKREIESINEMTNVFCFAIEEERPIQQELLLDGDQFVVKSNVSMFPEDPKRFAIPTEEAHSPLRFRMVQLGRLIDIFERIAPRGTISERALIYVLQDLVSCGEEDCYPSFVPCAWQQLRPPDIEKLIEGLFGTTEYIDWREFVVYAMDLPVPSHEDILKTRMAFRMQDHDLRETVTQDQFHLTPLWFLEISTRHEKFLDEELERNNYNEMDMMLRKEARLSECISNLESNFLETDKDNSSAILRLMLAKELLCRMYLVNRNAIHYTAMLLAFCKDEDPREGLGKAFTLAMGTRICTDTAEGERYVDELLEEKRRAKKLELSKDYLREKANEIVREIINHIMNRVTKTIIIFEKIHDHDLLPKHRIMIQQLNGLGEIDPAQLLPPEVTAEHLVVDLSVSSDEQKTYLPSIPSADGEPEDYEMIRRDNRMIFWLPRDVCLTVLSTCLPWIASQANIFQTSMSLCEAIAHVYNELKDEELNDDENLVLVHRLLNHSFIRELLSVSDKFVSKNMTDLVRNILKEKHITI